MQNLDIAPTLLDAASVPIPDRMQGRSLRPLLAGQASPHWRDSIYYHFYESAGWGSVPAHYGVRTARHKLIRFYEIDAWEMYDLETDPDELHSVYDDPEYATLCDQLEAELVRFRSLYKVPEEANASGE